MRDYLVTSVNSVDGIILGLGEIVGINEVMEKGEEKGKLMMRGDDRENLENFLKMLDRKIETFQECLFVSSVSAFYPRIVEVLKFDLEYNTECGWSLAYGKVKDGTIFDGARYICASDGVVWNYWLILA